MQYCLFLPITASADSLNDNIDEQLGNLDLSEIEEYLDSLTQDEQGVFSNGFLQVVKEILNGDAQYSISDVFSVFFGGIISDFNNLVPHFVIILAISVLCGLIHFLKIELSLGKHKRSGFLYLYDRRYSDRCSGFRLPC